MSPPCVPPVCPWSWMTAPAAWCVPVREGRRARTRAPATRVKGCGVTTPKTSARGRVSVLVSVPPSNMITNLITHTHWQSHQSNFAPFLLPPSSSWGRGVCLGWFCLSERPDLYPQLQVPVHVPWRADHLRAALQPRHDAARPGLPHASQGAGARRVLRKVGVWPPGWGQRFRWLRHGRWADRDVKIIKMFVLLWWQTEKWELVFMLHDLEQLNIESLNSEQDHWWKVVAPVIVDKVHNSKCP